MGARPIQLPRIGGDACPDVNGMSDLDTAVGYSADAKQLGAEVTADASGHATLTVPAPSLNGFVQVAHRGNKSQVFEVKPHVHVQPIQPGPTVPPIRR